MVAAHGNSLRSIIMYLDRLTSQEVASCNCYDCHHLIYALLIFFCIKYVLHRNNRTGLGLFFTSLWINRSLIQNYQLGYHCFTYIKRESSSVEEVQWDLRKLVFMHILRYNPLAWYLPVVIVELKLALDASEINEGALLCVFYF